MDFQDRKQRWIDFFDLSSNVNRMIVVYCAEGMPKLTDRIKESKQARIEYSYERYIKQLEQAAIIPSHDIPNLTMTAGTEIFAEAFGCEVIRPPHGSAFAIPYVLDAAAAAKVRIPRLEDTKMADLFDIAHALKKRLGAHTLLSLPDIQSPGDIAAMIWEKTDFFAAMIETPEAVLELIEKIRTFMFSYLDLWFRTFGNEMIAHYPDYYMPYGITLSEDEIGSVSPAMFRTFFEPSLRLFSERYGAIGIHCCADSRHQWENLKGIPNLKLINLHRDTSQTLESMEFFRGVCAQMPFDSAADPDTLQDQSGLHAARFVYVDSVDDARRAAEAFMGKGSY